MYQNLNPPGIGPSADTRASAPWAFVQDPSNVQINGDNGQIVFYWNSPPTVIRSFAGFVVRMVNEQHAEITRLRAEVARLQKLTEDQTAAVERQAKPRRVK